MKVRYTMAKKKVTMDFTFFKHLWMFYQKNRKTIISKYKGPTRKFLQFNGPENPNRFLRTPQFEAFEMYVFLKEGLKNLKMSEIFNEWYDRTDMFNLRERGTINVQTGQMNMLDEMTRENYEQIFETINEFGSASDYANYIFALTMGTGKTILMATCIFYEFVLAHKLPKDPLYCHNALVFAPDKTVLSSLLEIQTFDKTKVVPAEYVNFLNSNIKYFFLEDTETDLNTVDGSDFNIVITNNQKIILKKEHKKKTAGERLFKYISSSVGVLAEAADVLPNEEPEDDKELIANNRFYKLNRLPQLGIYVDEAHHVFGSQLARDLGLNRTKTSLKLTIDEIAKNLNRSGSRVVACYNYTGTPYVKKTILPEVVYGYGLKDAIDNEYLKRVRLKTYSDIRSEEFVRDVIEDFWRKYGENRHENMLPKIAFFAPTIKDLEKDLKPSLEKVLYDLGISSDKILVNHEGSDSDSIREFSRLDTPESEKQFILLVNKGKEGWNCRSLFAVALFRKPDSTIFVLQATMRCLRSIDKIQQTASIYLSSENEEILKAELDKNFRMSINELKNAKGKEKQLFKISVRKPPIEIKITRVKMTFHIEEIKEPEKITFDFDKVSTDKYKILVRTIEDVKIGKALDKQTESTEDITSLREKRKFSRTTLVAEIARYLNISCLRVERILERAEEEMEKILECVNEYNEILYDHVIPKIFRSIHHITEREENEQRTVLLVKEPESGYYEISGDPEKTVALSDYKTLSCKSFHLDTYCFDSKPEMELFIDLLKSSDIEKVYFTGMLTHGQTEFYISYIDPESEMVRHYYPDFLVKKGDDGWSILEVKADNMIDDAIVQAKKEAAEQFAVENEMTYSIVSESEVRSHSFNTKKTNLNFLDEEED